MPGGLSAPRRQPFEFQLDVRGNLQQLRAIVLQIVEDFETDRIDRYQLTQVDVNGTCRSA
jgi:hypothetical protein